MKITTALLILFLTPTAFADPGCSGVHMSEPTIVVDRAMSHAQGYATVSLTCTDGLPYAIESAQTPGGVFELTNGTGGVIQAVLRDAETGAPLGPMAHNEHLGQTGTGGAQAVPLRIDLDLALLPPPGQYRAMIVLSVEF